MAEIWGAALAAVAVVGSAVYSSNKAEDQAEIQADAIIKGGEIDSAARGEAISQVLEVFSPALAEFNNSMQDSIDLLDQGRISSAELLTQSAQNVTDITQRGGQSALNAMLGLPAPAAQQQQPTTPQQPQQPKPEEPTNGAADFQREITPDNTPVTASKNAGIVPTTMDAQPAGMSIGGQPPRDSYNPNQDFGGGTQLGAASQTGSPSTIPGNYSQDAIGPNPIATPTATPVQSAFAATDPLTTNFDGSSYSLNNQGITMPTGTNAGLLGAESAVQSGADLGRYDLAMGATAGLERLGIGTATARNDIIQGRDTALGQMGQGLNAIQDGTTAGVNSINRGVSQATSYLNPYMQAGTQALDPYLNLSGVNGQEAFDSALLNDPSYNYALKNSETSLARNAAVTGGIGSGNTGARYIQNAQEMGAANVDNQLSRLRYITDAGQAAAGTAGGFATQGGIAAGSLQSQGGQAQANQYNNMANVGINSSRDLADYAQQLGISENDVLNQLGGNLANIDVGTGNTIGSMRETAGINAAGIIQGTSDKLAGIDAGLAEQLYTLDQDTINNIVNSLQTGAGTTLDTNKQLATILGNMGIGAGTSASNTAINLGQANASGVTNPIGNALNTGIGLYASGAFNNTTNPYQPANNAVSEDQFIANNQNVSWGT